MLITQKDGLLQTSSAATRAREVSAECEGAKANLVKFRAEIRNLEREKVRMLAALANARARPLTSPHSRASPRGRDEGARQRARGDRAHEGREQDRRRHDSGLEQRVRAIRDEAKHEAARRELDELKRA